MEVKTKLNLTPAPRRVPYGVRMLLLFGSYAQVGWVLVGLGACGMWWAGGDAVKSSFAPSGVLAVPCAAVLPLVGCAIVAVRWVRGRRWVRLLRNGEVAAGTVVDRQPRSRSDEDTESWLVRATYVGADGLTREYREWTTRPVPAVGARVRILHDPRRPERAVMMRLLPAAVRPDRSGEWRAALCGELAVVLPLIVVLGHGSYLVYVLTR